MKVIFLDIDHVLNTTESLKQGIDLIPEKIRLISRLTSETQSKIVISSSWRYCYSISEIQNLFLNSGWNTKEIPIIGMTPETKNEFICRGKQIQNFLDSRDNIKKYVIIDDRDDMLKHQIPFLVKTNKKRGFTFLHYRKAKQLLNNH